MEYLIISFQALLPLIIMVLIGYVLKKANVVDSSFNQKSSTILFNLAFPVMLFYNITNADVEFVFDWATWRFILFACAIVLISYLLAFLIAEKNNWDNRTKGAFVQGAYRGNYIIIGFAILENLFGNEVSVGMSLITAFIVPLFNTLAVINFTYYEPEYDKINYLEMIKGTIRNPLIIGILVALLFNYLNIKVPVTVNDTLFMIKGIAVPMALINIGSMFSLRTDLNERKPLVLAVLFKVVLFPLMFTIIAILFGFRGPSLGILFVLLASPTATVSFIMAKAMHSNDTLAAAIIVFSTAASFFTIFIGVSLLNALGFF
ncbi:MAG TPA: hypothetical protein DCG34_10230 [Clostridiales bacterium]|nr:hypothetical protein [Clostridiales bacterium]